MNKRISTERTTTTKEMGRTKTTTTTSTTTETALVTKPSRRTFTGSPQRRARTMRITQAFAAPSWDSCIDYCGNEEDFKEILHFDESWELAENSGRWRFLFQTLCEIVDELIAADDDIEEIKAVLRDSYLRRYTSTNECVFLDNSDIRTIQSIIGNTLALFPNDREEVVARLMDFFTPLTWRAVEIHGAVQREFARILYPTEIITEADILLYEAYFFNMQYEYTCTYREDEERAVLPGFWSSDEVEEYFASFMTREQPRIVFDGLM